MYIQNIFETTFEHTITVENATLTFFGYSRKNRTTSPRKLPQIYHTHAYAELFYCKSGEILLKYDDMTVSVCEGTVAFIPPKFPHFMEAPPNCEVFAVGIKLQKKNLKENFNVHKNIQNLFNSTEPVFFRNYTHILPEDMGWMEKFEPSSTAFVMLSAFYTLSKLSDIYTKRISHNEEDTSTGRKFNILVHLEHYIDGRYYENLTTENLSSMLYISPRQLARIVHERYGTSLHRVIMKKRIETATKLLKESNLSVENISYAVGFDTKSCFYRMFKKEYGTTPLQYRKKQQQKSIKEEEE